MKDHSAEPDLAASGQPVSESSEGTMEDSSVEEGTPSLEPALGPEGYPQEVEFLEVEGRTIILVGTAHVSRASVDLVREVITREEPDCVCVELDPQRFQALSEKKKWESLDLKEVIRKKQLATLLVNLMLASYQKRLGHELGVEPGTELLEATKVAEENGVPVALCDRDVRITLRRAARNTPFFKKIYLMSYLLAALFEKPEISEEQMQELKQQDVLNELMNELGRAMPSLKTALIDERDAYLSTKILGAEGKRLVAVVGAGHMRGIRAALTAGQTHDLESLDVIPPVSKVWKAVGWGIPALILGSIAWIGYSQGSGEAGHNIVYWILANGIPSSIGAIIGLLHPLTILAAFVGAPITSLTPVVGAGYVCAFVQAWVSPPTVKEFQTVTDDVGILKRWWQSRLLKIFLAFTLPAIGSFIGTWIGGIEIFRNLF